VLKWQINRTARRTAMRINFVCMFNLRR
jgi:hypothetical protein